MQYRKENYGSQHGDIKYIEHEKEMRKYEAHLKYVNVNDCYPKENSRETGQGKDVEEDKGCMKTEVICNIGRKIMVVRMVILNM